jgi:hypothetical protein
MIDWILFAIGLGAGAVVAALVTRQRMHRHRIAAERLHGALVGINTVSQNSLCRATNEWDEHLADLIEEHANLAKELSRG